MSNTTTTSNNTHTQKDVDLARASVPIGPIASGVIFLILQIVAITWFFGEQNSRISHLEFSAQRTSLALEELENKDTTEYIKNNEAFIYVIATNGGPELWCGGTTKRNTLFHNIKEHTKE